MRPPATVLAAFGTLDDPVPLPGGQGGSWRAGRLVLKPVGSAAETRWRSEVLSGLSDSAEFRVARPVRAGDGDWLAEGWEATELLAGETDVRRPVEVVAAGAAFHAALVDLPRPALLDDRDDPWSVGDRVAWQELRSEPATVAAGLLAPLFAARRPVEQRAQLVHGDLAGNVLFAAGLPPAIIDWSVYWRPPAFASAVVVVDALCWYGASAELAARWADSPDWGQLLIRALIFRIVTHEVAFGAAGWTPEQLAAYRPVIDLAIGYATGG
ncbi:MAG TPA: TIGR02569 family protein [Pseudonocardiaceae bacterium]|jgi:uncharacterized protein (TIGR02569 family)|nr:TIGR02569 family protein [Pseudonocardiaceae bacterium]